MTHRTDRTIANLTNLANLCHERHPRIITNLHDNLPGYPPATSSFSAHTVTTTSTTERLATTGDPVLTAWTEYHAAARAAETAVTRLTDAGARWHYTTSNNQDHHKHATTNNDWCTSCLRIHQCAPRYRGDLCRWCYDFHTAQGKQPSIELLDAHHRGTRITERMVRTRTHNTQTRHT